jgi:hypothetical protein
LQRLAEDQPGAVSKTVKPMRQVAVTSTTLPSAELTHALAGMVLSIVSQALHQ